MKKKVFTTLFITFGLLVLIGCKKTSEEAKAVIDKINTIGSVDYDDEALIGECEDMYTALTPEQQSEVSNLKKLAQAREEMDKLLEARPIAFSNANWESTKDDIIGIMGREPDEEYEKDGTILQYNGCSYEGYDGLIRYGITDGVLDRALFVISKDSNEEEVYNHFIDLYSKKYGEPYFENDVGKVWRKNNTSISAVILSNFFSDGGEVVITYNIVKEE